MNEPNFELIHDTTQGILDSLARVALENGVEPEELARRCFTSAFIALANANEADSFLLTLRRRSDGTWGSHTHYDYLDADPEHLRQDFYWERATEGDS